MRRYCACLSLFVCSVFGVLAQLDTVQFCDPGVEGQGRPKGIELNYERTVDYGISGVDPASNEKVFNSEVRRVRRLSGKMRAPLFLRDGLQIYAGASFHHEGYAFEKDTLTSKEILGGLNDQPLNSSSFSLYILKPRLNNQWFYFRGNLSLNQNLSTVERPTEFFKFGFTGLYGFKRSERLAYGFGVSVGYLFGEASIYPVVMYNRTFNEKWGIELTLPARTKLRYNANEKNLFYWVNEVDGANYDLDLVVGGIQGVYFFERTELETKVVFEREIYDFLWLSVNTGLRIGYALNLSDDFGLSQGRVILEGQEDPALRIGAGLFFVPPKKWSN